MHLTAPQLEFMCLIKVLRRERLLVNHRNRGILWCLKSELPRERKQVIFHLGSYFFFATILFFSLFWNWFLLSSPFFSAPLPASPLPFNLLPRSLCSQFTQEILSCAYQSTCGEVRGQRGGFSSLSLLCESQDPTQDGGSVGKSFNLPAEHLVDH